MAELDNLRHEVQRRVLAHGDACCCETCCAAYLRLWLHETEAALATAEAERDEAHSSAFRWREEAWECYVQSGADPDGERDGSRLNPGEAVRAVKELRSDYDADTGADGDNIRKLTARAEAAEAQVEAVREAIMERQSEALEEGDMPTARMLDPFLSLLTTESREEGT